MELKRKDFTKIVGLLPVQRGNVAIENYTFMCAILYMVEQGCKWRALPERFGKWNSVYKRARRWAERGVLERVFEDLHAIGVISFKITSLKLDSKSIKVHPDAHGAQKKEESSL